MWSLPYGAPPIAAAESPAEEQPRNLTLEDYFRLKPVRDPQVSPDGRWVAYTVGEPNKKEDRWETRIWMTATGGGEAIPMTSQRRAASWPSSKPKTR